MPIIAKVGEGFVLCPAGTHDAVSVDVEDLGMVETEYAGEKKKQHKVRIIWQVDELQDNGKAHQAAKRYTLSLHEKASLRKDLESWRGRPFTASELEGFDLENLIGAGAFLNVIHESKNGKTYDNIASIMRLPKNTKAPDIVSYTRVCNRKPQEESVTTVDNETWAPSDSDVPF